MSILSDIVPLVENVEIRGRIVEVRGVEVGHIPALVLRFPILRDMAAGNSLVADAIIRHSSALVDAIIAAGIGKIGDGAEEAGIANLSLGERARLLAAVIRVTGGLGPFVELMGALGLSVSVEDGADEGAAKTLPRGKFRGQGHRSNGLSQSASTA